jgi:hypothetical protein
MKIAILFLLFFSGKILAQSDSTLDELDPHRSDIEIQLRELDILYQEETGRSAFLEIDLQSFLKPSCFRNSCPVWADVDKGAQKLYLYLDGILSYTWPISTGKRGYETPDFDRHPNGRVYDRYTSTQYPDGDYNGLGNMPYAVFISGGYAIHGTTKSNWSKLGKRASHGCVRLHPDNAQIFNRLTRQFGILGVWITVN